MKTPHTRTRIEANPSGARPCSSERARRSRAVPRLIEMLKSGVASTIAVALSLMLVVLDAGPLAAALGSPLLQEQAHPSFAGHWVLSARPAGEIPAICRVECIISQDEKTLTVRDVDGSLIQSYLLGGPPQKTTKTVFGHVLDETITSRWEGRVLLIDRVTVLQPETTPSESHLRISLVHGNLIFERTMKSSTAAPVVGRGGAPVQIIYAPKGGHLEEARAARLAR